MESQAASNYQKLDFYLSVGGLFWRSLSNGPPQTMLSCQEQTKLCHVLNGFFCIFTDPAESPCPSLFSETRHQQQLQNDRSSLCSKLLCAQNYSEDSCWLKEEKNLNSSDSYTSCFIIQFIIALHQHSPAFSPLYLYSRNSDIFSVSCMCHIYFQSRKILRELCFNPSI